MKHSVFLAALLSIQSACLLTGCYNRLTDNYLQFPDIADSQSAVVEESEFTQEDRERRLAIPRKWEQTPLPPYTINPGDKVSVNVYNQPDLKTETVVTPDGYIGMVFIGQIHVAGLTLPQAAEKIGEALKPFIRQPRVGITPVEVCSETVTIAGAARFPKIYPIFQGMRLADLYAQAGGSSVRRYDGQDLDAADLQNSVFVRDGKVLELDFKKAIEQGDKDHNVLLRKGDYIYIAVRSESMVCLIGDVSNPHKRIWDNHLGILELLTTGGGLKETYWPFAIIIRGGIENPTMYKVDIDGILQGRCPDVMLEPNDIVYVPHDNISEFNVFIRKLLPTGQLLNLLTTPFTWKNL